MSVVPGTILPPICVIMYWPKQDGGEAVAVGVGEAVGVDVGVGVKQIEHVDVGVDAAVGVGVAVGPMGWLPVSLEVVGSCPVVSARPLPPTYRCPSANGIAQTARSRNR
jgi:hypothetical protein